MHVNTAEIRHRGGSSDGRETSFIVVMECCNGFSGQPLAHWVRLLDAVDCCVTPVLDLDEAQRHPLFAIHEQVDG